MTWWIFGGGKNPNVFRYTWHSSPNPPVQCTLDYFLVSFNLYSQINECNISPAWGGHSNGKRGYQARPWTHKKHPNHVLFRYEKRP